jgi:NAD(P)-dependent dehydrogenase (short-subunit alcohol dehydrogenase family)
VDDGNKFHKSGGSNDKQSSDHHRFRIRHRRRERRAARQQGLEHRHQLREPDRQRTGGRRACEAHGAETLLAKANVAEDADCRRMAADAMTKWGRIDALVNSAGTTRFADHADLEALSGDDFLEVYRINVVGPWQMVRAVVPHMKAGGHGAIVNISSGAGIRGTGSSVAYATSKAGLNIMTLSLARNLGPEIRANVVCPAMVTGRWWQEHLGPEKYEAQFTNFANSTPLKRRVSPEDIAAPWLADRRRGRRDRADHYRGRRRFARRARSPEMNVRIRR